ncbi:YraN family protein [Edwardsiella ictaluri]|uniref:YraN family protein n=1 Tax=Edwardsiella ictaluri TaxID=67780 RepID=UPI003784EE87
MAAVPERQHRSGSVTAHQIGAYHEQRARRYLERAGLRFYAANVRLRGGEIDLIMRDGATWVFVEVRYRKTACYDDAAASIDSRKRQRLQRCAAHWLAVRNQSIETADCRFDVLAITGSQLQWLPNAFV